MVDIPFIEPRLDRDPFARAFTALDRTVPIALLPVRLETRWFAGAVATDVELRVRIFPDAIHIIGTGGVQPLERDAVNTYWRVRGQAGDDAPATAAAWGRLVSAVGDARARWLRTTFTPGTPEPPLDDDPGLPEAQAMPDRFVVLGYEQQQRRVTVWGAPVPRTLAVGPGGFDDTARRWQVDFAAAEAVGMAARVRMSRADAARLTRIAVLGVRSSESAAAGASLLGDLVDGHARYQGASLLPGGTPTNHTATRRATARDDDDGAGSVPSAGSDGARLATALGFAAERLRHVGGAAMRTHLACRAMHVATWPATWGYFLEHVIGRAVTAEHRAGGRRLFVEHVRGLGPFTALCLGRQPYGVLPVSSLSRWKTDAGSDDDFVRGLGALLPRWRTSGTAAARLPASGDPMPALLDVLAHQPTSVRWMAREAATPEIAGHWWWSQALSQAALAVLLAQLRRPIAEELTHFGLLPAPDPVRIDPKVYADQPVALELPLVRSRRSRTALEYLPAMAAARDLEALRRHELPGASPRTLLYLLLRHATLLVAARATDDVLALGAVAREERDVHEDPADTVWSRLARPAPAFGGRTARELVSGVEIPVHPFFSELREHRTALSVLAAMPVEQLELLTAESLDVCSHRLDAWATAVATRRVMDRRAAGGTGTHVGAYAWVDAPPLPAVPARDGVPVMDPGHGHVHAPSLDHARTAAVLRAGFVARPGEDLAVDLSSRRVRQARWLLAGLRAGQSLSALLGYRVERVLANADDIAAARDDFPLAGAGGDPSTIVLDGLAAYRAWRDGTPAPRFARAASELLELVDGLSDLLLAESVHQHVRGNTDRTAVLLEALSAGTVAPPEPAVSQTPIDSERTAWQVVVSAGDGDGGWPGDAARPRARANPALDAWLARTLGDPAALAATVRFRAADGIPGEIPRTVADLDLCALDLAALAGTSLAASPLLTLFAGEAPAGATEISVVPAPALEEAHLLARAFHDAVHHARPWNAENPDPAWDADADAALALLEQLLAEDGESARRRLAAILGAPVADRAAAGNLLGELVSKIRGASSAADRIRGLSGFTPPGRGAPPAPIAADVLASASQQRIWFADVGRVRPIMGALTTVATLGRGARPPLTASRPSVEKVVVVIGAPAPVLRGLIVDSWTESRPLADTTTGVALHHDAPRARPPQAIWLAVPPDPRAAWTLGTLEAIVIETIDLMTARLARPAEVWGPLLPAIYFAENLDDETVSTTLADVAVNVVVRG